MAVKEHHLILSMELSKLHYLEKYRVLSGTFASGPELGMNGVFIIPHPAQKKVEFICIVSDKGGWKHISVSMQRQLPRRKETVKRCPTWDEMCYIKQLFFEAEESAVQYHPPESQYKNLHPFVLHLWRPLEIEMPFPPLDYV